MEKTKKLELVQRSLGLKHKLKVHESMKQPDTHEDLALMLLAKWEYEDELKAIDEIMLDVRTANVSDKKKNLLKEYVNGSAGSPKAVNKKK
ncbi:hypothetical protein K2X30_10125 [bacterium]|nr:hypothetical protein [bacterium]